MSKTKYVFEYGWLKVPEDISEIQYKLLAQYITQNPSPAYYTVYFNRIRFCNYVGVIKVGDLTIEVLPKTENHDKDEKLWRNVLLQMLAISLQVKARTTTYADIHIRQHSVLETYLQVFLEEAENLMHQGLVKKYRKNINNQTALKGKLLIHQNITKNLVQQEYFYVEHQIYNTNNIYNAILYAALNCIHSLQTSLSTAKSCEKLLLNFPECSSINITEKLFERLEYNRKTECYRRAIELARIILLNYHPDLQGGHNNILAIMFDMNLLWETYVCAMLQRAKNTLGTECSVRPQRIKTFWKHQDNWRLHLIPDIEIIRKKTDEIFILDTKWKYKKDASMEDVRQMYAYGNYFHAKKRYLLYPDHLLGKSVDKKEGIYFDTESEIESKEQKCGQMYIDPLKGDGLNKEIGQEILKELFS